MGRMPESFCPDLVDAAASIALLTSIPRAHTLASVEAEHPSPIHLSLSFFPFFLQSTYTDPTPHVTLILAPSATHLPPPLTMNRNCTPLPPKLPCFIAFQRPAQIAIKFIEEL